MEISASLLPNSTLVPARGWAIVIDTLRFTTTACQALHVGASSISVGSEIEEVRTMAAQASGASLLCGERHCTPIQGFDLGNSPWEYTADKIDGKQLFFTTTNGTRAIAACQNAAKVILAAFVNRSAVSDYIQRTRPRAVHFVCAGTDGQIALEDTLAAGAIMERLDACPDIDLKGDEARIALASWQAIAHSSSDNVEDAIRVAFDHAAGGINLVEAGFQRDLDFAAQLDRIGLVPRAEGSGSEFRRVSEAG